MKMEKKKQNTERLNINLIKFALSLAVKTGLLEIDSIFTLLNCNKNLRNLGEELRHVNIYYNVIFKDSDLENIVRFSPNLLSVSIKKCDPVKCTFALLFRSSPRKQ